MRDAEAGERGCPVKLEARRDDVRLTLETNTLQAHALMTDQRAAVEAALSRAATWFQAEVERLLAPPATVPVFAPTPDGGRKLVGRRITEPNASPLVYHGRTFGVVVVDDGSDPLAEFRPEPQR